MQSASRVNVGNIIVLCIYLHKNLEIRSIFRCCLKQFCLHDTDVLSAPWAMFEKMCPRKTLNFYVLFRSCIISKRREIKLIFYTRFITLSLVKRDILQIARDIFLCRALKMCVYHCYYSDNSAQVKARRRRCFEG